MQPYLNEKKLLIKNQSSNDIAKAMVEVHKEHENEYQQICSAFDAGTYQKSAKLIWQYLKKYSLYKVESETNQRLMAPAAILNLLSKGIDCKNYSLFTAGIMCALAKKHQWPVDIAFRFASYDIFNKQPEHVFVVVKPKKGQNLWIDAVLPSFDSHATLPAHYFDKKICTMALYKISGIGVIPPPFIAAGTKAGADILTTISRDLLPYIPQLFSKQGISPKFFEKFEFLNVFDNSTGKWKSRVSFLKDKTPEERLAFYMQSIQSGEPPILNSLQYSESFGSKMKQDRGTTFDLPNVDQKMLRAYNALVETQQLKGAAGLQIGANFYPRDYLIQPTTGAGSILNDLGILRSGDGSGTGINQASILPGGGNTNFLWVAGIAAALFFIAKKS